MFEKKYKVCGWKGKNFSMTAMKLRDRVLQDSKSNYNWIASATELVRICNLEQFPQDIAVEIKRAILNCFANIATDNYDEGYQEPTDDQAVRECFNTLDSNDKLNEQIKQKYVKQILNKIVFGSFEFPPAMLYGDGYRDFGKQWISNKMEELKELQTLTSSTFTEISKQFSADLKAADKNGVFEKSKNYYAKNQEKFKDSIFSTIASIPFEEKEIPSSEDSFANLETETQNINSRIQSKEELISKSQKAIEAYKVLKQKEELLNTIISELLTQLNEIQAKENTQNGPKKH